MSLRVQAALLLLMIIARLILCLLFSSPEAPKGAALVILVTMVGPKV
jgi:hypothetical protein